MDPAAYGAHRNSDNEMTLSSATSVRVAAGSIFTGTVIVCGLWATEVHWRIMDKVNARLPEGEKFKPLFWGPLKRARLNDEYRRLFPDGSDLKQLHRLIAIMFAALGLLFLSFMAGQLF